MRFVIHWNRFASRSSQAFQFSPSSLPQTDRTGGLQKLLVSNIYTVLPSISPGRANLLGLLVRLRWKGFFERSSKVSASNGARFVLVVLLGEPETKIAIISLIENAADLKIVAFERWRFEIKTCIFQVQVTERALPFEPVGFCETTQFSVQTGNQFGLHDRQP